MWCIINHNWPVTQQKQNKIPPSHVLSHKLNNFPKNNKIWHQNQDCRVTTQHDTNWLSFVTVGSKPNQVGTPLLRRTLFLILIHNPSQPMFMILILLLLFLLWPNLSWYLFRELRRRWLLVKLADAYFYIVI